MSQIGEIADELYGRHERSAEVPADALAKPCRAGQLPSPSIAAGGDNGALNGTYRVEISQDDLRAAGVTDPHDREINEGIWTWTLRDGHYAFDQRQPGDELVERATRLQIVGNRAGVDVRIPAGPPAGASMASSPTQTRRHARRRSTTVVRRGGSGAGQFVHVAACGPGMAGPAATVATGRADRGYLCAPPTLIGRREGAGHSGRNGFEPVRIGGSLERRRSRL